MFENEPDIVACVASTSTAEVPVASTSTVEAQVASRDSWYRRRFDEVRNHPNRFSKWEIRDNHLYFRRPSPWIEPRLRDLNEWKLVLPKKFRDQAIRESHDTPQAGHLGVDKTCNRLAREYYWPDMFRDVQTYVRLCPVCQRCKVEQASPVGLMGRRTVVEPWTVVAVDMMGPFPPSRSGKVYVLVIQDLFTKWVEFCALRKANSPAIQAALSKLVISRWGTPQVLLTDNGTEFRNTVMCEFTQEKGIVNRVLKTMIVEFINEDQRDWDIHISEFRFACNTAVHSSTRFSPAFLNMGREPRPVASMRRHLEASVEIERQPPDNWAIRMRRLTLMHDWVTGNLGEAFRR